ncbi:hypothetical protein MVEN_00983400 [Mycena venus]|uniref:Uncharacterized protein n=1 Tax=Mycena venus TaxID=2733690 RepID=A0A8H7D201_9AGAR|nr:hypothetical protein MVEN_00983400 [Mycena venus]
MPSPSRSSHLSSDIRPLIDALAQNSLQTSSKHKGLIKHHDNGNNLYHHIATFLTRDGMKDEQADISLAGAAMYRHFGIFAMYESSSSEPTPASCPPHEDPLVSKTKIVTPGKFRSKGHTDVRFVVTNYPQIGDTPEAVLKTGLDAADLNQHISDVNRIYWVVQDTTFPTTIEKSGRQVV